jgi:hypothetical protein
LILTTSATVTRPADVNVPIGSFGTLLASSSAQITLNAGATPQGVAPLLSANGATLVGRGSTGAAYTSVGQILGSSNTASWSGANVVGLGWNPAGSTVNLNGTTTTDTVARVPAAPFNFASAGGTNLFWNGYVTKITGASSFAGCTTGGCTPQAPPKTYFFANTGSDAANCMTSATACQTIGKLNSFTYAFGDSISLDAGSSFTGCISITNANAGLTAETQPIVIGKYNTGTPVLTTSCTGDTGGILFDNVSGITLQDIDLEEGGASSPRAGVRIQNTNVANIMNGGFIVQRMIVHGFAYAPTDFGGEIFLPAFPGIGLENISLLNNTMGGRSGPTSTDDNCIISFGAINITNWTIQGNTCSNIGGATAPAGDLGYGIQPSASANAVVSFNLVFNGGRNTNSCGSAYAFEIVQANNPIFKFNEAYGQASTGAVGCDNGGFDLDNSTVGGILEYNYAHNNLGPGFMLFEGSQNGFPATNNVTARFNITENDGTLNSGGSIVNQNPAGVANIYNNTVWQPTLTGGQQPGALAFCCTTSYGGIGLIANNIFVTQQAPSTGDSHFIGNDGGGTVSAGGLLKTFKANTWYANGGGTNVWLNSGINTLAAWQAFAAGGDTGAITTIPGFVGAGGTAGTCSWTPPLNNGPQPCPLSVYGITSGAGQRGTGFSTNSISGGDGGRDYNGVSIPNGVGTGYNMGADGH